MRINGREIGLSNEPYIIAELSANHNQSLDTALKLIDAAAEAGVDAIKLQTFTPDTITLNSDREDFQIKEGLWKGQTLYQLYEAAYMPWDWHEPLFNAAKGNGLTIFSSPFDNSAVDLLESLDAPAYKIASFEVTDLPLIKRVAETEKPMLISSGMATFEEVAEAVAVARSNGCPDIAVFQCVSGYPAMAEEYNLKRISRFVDELQVVAGLSDHTLSSIAAVTSVGLGGRVFEKHFTISRGDGSPDDAFSVLPNEMRAYVRDIRSACQAVGDGSDRVANSEKQNLQFRRSLYFTNALLAGDIVTEEDIRSVRPGYGAEPRLLDYFIGKKAKWDIEKNSPAHLDMIVD